MTRLKRSVLPIVGETQKLARLALQRLISAQSAQGGQAEDRRGGAASSRGQGSQFGIVGALAATVRHTAVQTEGKRRLDELILDPRGILRGSRAQAHGLRQPGPTVPLHPVHTLDRLEPIVREPLDDLARVRRPGVCGAVVQEAALLVLFTALIRQVAGYEGGHVALWVYPPVHCVVLLPAFAAEGQGQQDPSTVAGHELLPIGGDVPLVRPFQRCVDRITAADELMQPKGKGRKVSIWIAGLVASQETLLDGAHAALLGYASQLRQSASGSLGTSDADGCSSAQATGSRFGSQPKGGLDPCGERIAHKVSVVVGRPMLGIADALAQLSHEHWIV